LAPSESRRPIQGVRDSLKASQGTGTAVNIGLALSKKPSCIARDGRVPAMEPKPKNLQHHRIRDVERLLRCCRNTVLAHIHAGRLRAVKVGGMVLIPDESLRKLLDGGK
jgi:excisionase family DNA binding protein